MTQENKRRRSLGKKIILIFLITLIGLIRYGFATGEIKYVETFRMSGESRGYIGRMSKILESEEHFAKVWEKLENLSEFKETDIHFYSINISTNRISVVIQDPQNPKYYDNYYYNGNSLNPKWVKDNPFKNPTYESVISNKDLNISGIYKFYSQIKDHVENNKIELEKDNPVSIYITPKHIYDTEIKLRGSVKGVRENISFESNVDGENFLVM